MHIFHRFPTFRQQFEASGSAIRSLFLDSAEVNAFGQFYRHTWINTHQQIKNESGKTPPLLRESYQAVFKLNNLQSMGNKAFVAISGGYLPLGNSCHLVQSGACQ